MRRRSYRRGATVADRAIRYSLGRAEIAECSHGPQQSQRSAAHRSCQAIAKAETVKATQRGWVGASTLCLGKTPGQDGLAALLLVVGGGTAEPTGDALAPTANASVLRCPGCRALTGHFIGRVLEDRRQRAAVRGDDLQAQRLQGARYAMVS